VKLHGCLFSAVLRISGKARFFSGWQKNCKWFDYLENNDDEKETFLSPSIYQYRRNLKQRPPKKSEKLNSCIPCKIIVHGLNSVYRFESNIETFQVLYRLFIGNVTNMTSQKESNGMTTNNSHWFPEDQNSSAFEPACHLTTKLNVGEETSQTINNIQWIRRYGFIMFLT